MGAAPLYSQTVCVKQELSNLLLNLEWPILLFTMPGKNTRILCGLTTSAFKYGLMYRVCQK